MRHIKLLGIALLAICAVSGTFVSVASAVEAGILFLGTETAPVTLAVANTPAATTLTLLPSKATVECTELAAEGTVGEAPQTHATLGSLRITYKGCKSSGLNCSSVNTKGEKDAAGTVLVVAEDTDLHMVALLNGQTELLGGILVGFLELEKKLDLTIVCGGVKVKVLGATFLEVKGKNLIVEETGAVEVLPTHLSCDTSDKLCKEVLAAWGTTIGGTLCPLAATTKEAADEECADLAMSKPAVVSFSKGGVAAKVLLDF